MNAESEVFEYSGLGGENVNRLIVIFWKKKIKVKVHIQTLHQSSHPDSSPAHDQDSGLAIRELPPLIHKRFAHACGKYTLGDNQVLFFILFAVVISGSYCCGRL